MYNRRNIVINSILPRVVPDVFLGYEVVDHGDAGVVANKRRHGCRRSKENVGKQLLYGTAEPEPIGAEVF